MELIAAAPFVRGRSWRHRALAGTIVGARRLALALGWLALRSSATSLPVDRHARRPRRCCSSGVARRAGAPEPARRRRLRPALLRASARTSTAGSRSPRRSRSSPRSTTSSRPSLAAGSVSQGDFLRLLVLRRAARRRLARDPLRRVRARRRRGARPGRAGDPRRSRAVPLRDLDARERCCEQGAPQQETLAASEGGGRRRAAGGALRDPRALLGRRQRAVRRGAHAATSSSSPPTAQLEVELEIDPDASARTRRADRGLPHRPGRTRERAQARGRDAGPRS